MSLSEDYRRVYSSNEPTTIPQTTLMIESANKEPVHSWTIAVSENCDWTVGLCDNRSARGYSMGQVHGRYALCLKGDQLSYLTGADNTVTEQSVTPERMSRPESVEVSWSPASFTVSFFSRSSARYGRRLIVSLDGTKSKRVTLSGHSQHARNQGAKYRVYNNNTKTQQKTRQDSDKMDTTSSLIKSVTRRVWSPPQRPFRVCSHNRKTRKGVTAGTLEELRERASQALLLSLSTAASLVLLVCEEDGTQVDSEDFFMALPDNTVLMALESGDTWRPLPGAVIMSQMQKPRNGKDIARVTFDLYRTHPKDVFGSLSVKATYRGLYSIAADFQCLGPKKILREALRVASTLLQATGHLLIASASAIRRIIEGAELWQPQRGHEYTTNWN
ncbi:hypothetical protein NHX12_014516 [Muraenolepis orangiensis]|uniref:CIDE-N domain-containing protein n=2 Tax=Muraenolepis orangiensis TaxID=630683 RepID=A0A9Q0I318_9TELE|nr:hypothetical protein NHX12_014516 [Muraenolepis orangiensis]